MSSMAGGPLRGLLFLEPFHEAFYVSNSLNWTFKGLLCLEKTTERYIKRPG